ncbi:hypothetical protein ACWCQZ_05725, partial [Streptomyces sp. NPDC002285]
QRASLLGELRDGRPMTRGYAKIAPTPLGGTPSGTTCPAPAAIRASWLDEYAVSRYREAFAVDGEVTRERLLLDGVRVTVAKGRSGGGPKRLAGPDTSRLTFTVGPCP